MKTQPLFLVAQKSNELPELTLAHVIAFLIALIVGIWFIKRAAKLDKEIRNNQGRKAIPQDDDTTAFYHKN